MTTDEHRRTDTTLSETSKADRDEFIGSTTIHQETSHTHDSSTQYVSSTSLGTSSVGTSSTSLGSTTSTSLATTTTTTTTTQKTTVYIPPQTDTTIPYVVTHKETNPPEPSTPDEYDNIIPDNHHPLPPEDYDQPPFEPEPETEPPVIKPQPPPRRNDRYERPYDGDYGGRGEKPQKPMKPRINSEAEERTAMIIGIVAGALIAVILVILLVLWIKSNGDRSYKMEHDLKYGHGANAALLGHNAGGGGQHSNVRHVGSAGSGNGAGHHGSNSGHQNGSHHMNQHHNQQYQQGNGYNQNSNYDIQEGGQNSPSMGLNGSLRQQQQGSSHYDRNGMSAGLVQPKAKRNSKDIKEWYV